MSKRARPLRFPDDVNDMSFDEMKAIVDSFPTSTNPGLLEPHSEPMWATSWLRCKSITTEARLPPGVSARVSGTISCPSVYMKVFEDSNKESDYVSAFEAFMSTHCVRFPVQSLPVSDLLHSELAELQAAHRSKCTPSLQSRSFDPNSCKARTMAVWLLLKIDSMPPDLIMNLLDAYAHIATAVGDKGTKGMAPHMRMTVATNKDCEDVRKFYNINKLPSTATVVFVKSNGTPIVVDFHEFSSRKCDEMNFYMRRAQQQPMAPPVDHRRSALNAVHEQLFCLLMHTLNDCDDYVMCSMLSNRNDDVEFHAFRTLQKRVSERFFGIIELPPQVIGSEVGKRISKAALRKPGDVDEAPTCSGAWTRVTPMSTLQSVPDTHDTPPRHTDDAGFDDAEDAALRRIAQVNAFVDSSPAMILCKKSYKHALDLAIFGSEDVGSHGPIAPSWRVNESHVPLFDKADAVFIAPTTSMVPMGAYVSKYGALNYKTHRTIDVLMVPRLMMFVLDAYTLKTQCIQPCSPASFLAKSDEESTESFDELKHAMQTRLVDMLAVMDGLGNPDCSVRRTLKMLSRSPAAWDIGSAKKTKSKDEEPLSLPHTDSCSSLPVAKQASSTSLCSSSTRGASSNDLRITIATESDDESVPGPLSAAALSSTQDQSMAWLMDDYAIDMHGSALNSDNLCDSSDVRARRILQEAIGSNTLGQLAHSLINAKSSMRAASASPAMGRSSVMARNPNCGLAALLPLAYFLMKRFGRSMSTADAVDKIVDELNSVLSQRNHSATNEYLPRLFVSLKGLERQAVRRDGMQCPIELDFQLGVRAEHAVALLSVSRVVGMQAPICSMALQWDVVGETHDSSVSHMDAFKRICAICRAESATEYDKLNGTRTTISTHDEMPMQQLLPEFAGLVRVDDGFLKQMRHHKTYFFPLYVIDLLAACSRTTVFALEYMDDRDNHRCCYLVARPLVVDSFRRWTFTCVSLDKLTAVDDVQFIISINRTTGVIVLHHQTKA